MRQFTCDKYLQVFFADMDTTDEKDDEIKPLRVNCKWMRTEIPNHIASQIGNFEGAFRRHFCPLLKQINPYLPSRGNQKLSLRRIST